ncbi:MAG: potassium-transporting ATPase subunit KdpA [Bacteroidota bacterium]|nr:potassium-transporting ATPase subunit KdpA [Bacteroidota bacterium]
MMTEYFGIIAMFGIALAIGIPLGKYIAKVYSGEKNFMDFISPIEKLIFRLCGINPDKEMDWKQHMVALLTINMIWFLYAMFMLMTQKYHFWNPDNNPSMSPELAFNTSISFMTNTNWQNYSGEGSASYLTQIAVLTFLQFVSAATGMAALVVIFNAFRDKVTDKLGNFYNYFVKSITRILLPISFFIAIIFLFNGMPQTFKGKDTIKTLHGDIVKVSRGPVASMVAIKHLGTNGGGFFGANSAHPFENPNYLTNMTEMIAQWIIPIAMVFAFGYYIKRKKLSRIIFGVMTLGFLLLVIPTIYYEMQRSPIITKMGINQLSGNMEGKEVRFGTIASAFWSIVTTVISTGSVNSMHDSFTPIGGMMQLLAMMVNAFYGGCGVGMLNYFIFLIITVFIAGLMVGRTPEFLGRKIEAKEMKIAVMVTLLASVVVKGGTAIAVFLYNSNPVSHAVWLTNPSYHGFSEMLYAFTSEFANNGSSFAGLNGNTRFWNFAGGLAMILGRYLPIIGPIAIAGSLAGKKVIPESAGTLRTDTLTFGIVTFAVIFITTALLFFPALCLGPLAEHFSLN